MFQKKYRQVSYVSEYGIHGVEVSGLYILPTADRDRLHLPETVMLIGEKRDGSRIAIPKSSVLSVR